MAVQQNSYQNERLTEMTPESKLPREQRIFRNIRALRERLREQIRAAGEHPDYESLHETADDLLLKFIGDQIVTKLHGEMAKWST